MKKTEYYINVKLGDDKKEYPKVSGYVEEIEDNNGNKFKIGYHKSGSKWVATELSTGLICSALSIFNTKAECVENVHNNLNAIVEAFEKTMNASAWVETYIIPFKRFVQLQEFLRS